MQAEDAKRRTLMFESQMTIGIEKQKAMIRVMEQAELNKVNREKEERGYQVDIFIEKLKAIGKEEENQYKEDRKDQRQNLIDTNMSKMISQRQQEKSNPINFENRYNLAEAVKAFKNPVIPTPVTQQ
jgi:hypothetical protein